MALPPPRGLWPRFRRALYWTHRWLGVAGCLLFVMWFISGIVMMYVAFPALTEEERLGGLSPLALDAVATDPAELLAGPLAPRRLVLETLAAGPQAGPVWRITTAEGARLALSARDGRLLARSDASTAQAIAAAFSGQADARYVETLERDQWTVPNGLNALRPLHRIELGDAADTVLYVSAVSGEVVRDTTRHERFWNWLGAVPHWLYFTPIRADPPFWRDLVLWISGASIVSAGTGLIIGILRIRVRSRYRSGRMTPYTGWFTWHHLAGLIGGVFLLTFIVSGWLSMDPNHWFQRAAADPQALQRYAGLTGPATTTTTATTSTQRPLNWPLAAAALDAAAARQGSDGWREIEVLAFDGRWLLQGRDARGHRTVIDAQTGEPAVIAATAIEAAAARYQPAARIVSTTLLTHEDAHWYSHHQLRPTPVWRIVYDDTAATWLHVSAENGQVLGSSDARSRLRRWLFNGLHSLDFPWLIQHRPAWDIVVWLLSLAGLIISVSGVVMGWRRLRRTRPGRHAPTRSLPSSPQGSSLPAIVPGDSR